MYNAASSGTWSSSNTAVATAGTNGVITGIANGSAVITYTYPVSCGTSSAVVTVNVIGNSGTVSGNTTVCAGTSSMLASSVSGGTWASSNPSTATADKYTGKITGVAAGTATITYSIATACGVYTTTTNVTVSGTSGTGTITGTGIVCGTRTLANPTGDAGGTWSSSNSSVATVGAATGVVTGITPGTANISFTSGGCSIAALVSVVHSSAGTITGTTTICNGGHVTLASSVPFGTWASGNTSVATIAAATGIVTGIATGSAPITYAITNACGSFSTTVTMNVAPGAGTIGGATVVCQGSTGSLGNLVTGGTWSIGNMAIATIGSSTGVVSGLAPGVVNISYTTAAGCISQKAVTVNALPQVSLAGNPTICPGSANAVLFYGASAGGVIDYNIGWDSTATANGFIRMGDTATGGIVSTAFGTGSPFDIYDVITDSAGNVYTGSSSHSNIIKTDIYGNSSAIATDLNGPFGMVRDNTGNIYVVEYFAHDVKKVSPSGIVTTIAGMYGSSGYTGDGGQATAAKLKLPDGLALDAANNLYISERGNNIIRKVSASGIISTLAAVASPSGIVIDASGNLIVASESTRRIIKVTPAGATSVFAGSGATGSAGDGGPATNASFGDPTDVTIDKYGNVYVSDFDNSVIRKITPSGIIYSIAGDARNHTHGLSGDGGLALNGQLYFPRAVAVDPSGNLLIADGGNSRIRKLSNIYSSVFPAGPITVPVSATAAAGTYSAVLTVSNASCSTAYPIAVNISSTTTSPIMNNSHLCIGSANLLTHAEAGGTWSSGNTSVATVGLSNGLVSAIAAGTASITYRAPTTCGTFSVTAVVTVDATASAGTITGAGTVCSGATVMLSNALSGGIWSSGNTAVATVGTSGMVTGVATGTVAISYQYTNGCGTASTFKIVTVNPSIDAGSISGAAAICAGASLTLSDAVGGGTWSSGNTSVATTGTSGIVTGIAAGTALISYTVTSECGVTANATTTVTINATPTPGITGGGIAICDGGTVTLSGTGADSYSWSGGISNGVPFAPATGVTTYTVTGTTGSCSGTAATTVTVNVLPELAITGGGTICNGTTTTLTATGADSYSWTGGITNGTPFTPTTGSHSYTVTGTTGDCSSMASTTITVNAIPTVSFTGGGVTICNGAIATLTGTGAESYSWTGGINDGTPFTPGTGTNNYTVTGTTSGCSGTAIATITVNATPSITTGGGSAVCAGLATVITAAGGTTYSWSPATGLSATSGASVTATPPATTTYTVTGTNAAGCTNTATRTVVVNPLPAAISGITALCVGASITVSNTVSGGSWSSNNTAIATIGSANGVLTGVASGTTTISYILSTGCYKKATVTVNPAVPAIAGSASVCQGTEITLTETPGGTWTSGNTSIATVTTTGAGASDGSNGFVTGIAPGTVLISYTLCGITNTKIATVNMLPSVPAINAGSGAVAAGTTLTLTESTVGGTHIWTSANTAVCTVDASSGVVSGLTAGTAVISYAYTSGCSNFATTILTVYRGYNSIDNGHFRICVQAVVPQH